MVGFVGYSASGGKASHRGDVALQRLRGVDTGTGERRR